MAHNTRLAIVIFASEIRVEVDVLTRGGAYRRIFYFIVNSLVDSDARLFEVIDDARLFEVIERELLWLLQAQDIVLHPGVPPEL